MPFDDLGNWYDDPWPLELPRPPSPPPAPQTKSLPTSNWPNLPPPDVPPPGGWPRLPPYGGGGGTPIPFPERSQDSGQWRTGDGGGWNSPRNFTWPQFTAPGFPAVDPFVAPPPFTFREYEAPAAFSYEPYAAPERFNYDAFAAPTLAQAENEPGYAFSRAEGIRALENAAAARGTLRSGMQLKDLLAWGNQYAQQNYQNVYNRAGQTYDRNRGNAFESWGANEAARAGAYDRSRSNAFDAWNANRANSLASFLTNRESAGDIYRTNYGVSADVFDRNFGVTRDRYDRNFNAALAEFNPRYRSAELTFADIYNRDRDRLDALTRIAAAGAGR